MRHTARCTADARDSFERCHQEIRAFLLEWYQLRIDPVFRVALSQHCWVLAPTVDSLRRFCVVRQQSMERTCTLAMQERAPLMQHDCSHDSTRTRTYGSPARSATVYHPHC